MKNKLGPGWLLLATLMLLLLLMTGAQCSAVEEPSYGAKVQFKRGVALQFPDFTLTYVGSRKVASPHFKPGFVFEDFTVVKDAKNITISWSAGTGDIGPTTFEVGGENFQLELRHADGFGWLKDNELVIKAKRR